MDYNIEVIKSVWRKWEKRNQLRHKTAKFRFIDEDFSVPGQCPAVKPEQAFAYFQASLMPGTEDF